MEECWGILGGTVGMVVSFNGMINGEVHPAKFAADGVMTIAGIYGGAVGAGLSVAYFVIDAYAPDFWPGVGRMISQGQQITEAHESDLIWHVH
nr:hypothetical protein [uncultured Pedobacter sp.]